MLYLRLGNVGHPSHNQLGNQFLFEKKKILITFSDVYQSRNKAAVISHRLGRLIQTGPINQRARPLSVHESALQRFLNTQKFVGNFKPKITHF